jgi:gliding motility-associated protein GldM
MINLLYVVYIGMLAMNVSSEVMKGYELVEESMIRSIKSTTEETDELYAKIADMYKISHEKVQIWYDKATDIHTKTKELTQYIEDVKKKFAINADRIPDADPEHLINKSELNAGTETMFAVKGSEGVPEEVTFKRKIDEFRTYAGSLVTNKMLKSVIDSCLLTEPSARARETGQSWTEAMFEHMPAVAIVVMMTQVEYSAAYVEQLVMRELLRSVDAGDFRVNKVEAFVIPEAKVVMRGGFYRADIVLAAVDSTQEPNIIVNGRELPKEAHGKYSAAASTTGTFQVKGTIDMVNGEGKSTMLNFATEYFVSEPSATIAPELMNILYAGIDNPIRIAVPGAADANVTATISAGSLTSKGNGIWSALPILGSNATIAVSIKVGGKQLDVAKNTFRVRPLPPPMAFLNVTNPDGNKARYRGGPIGKSQLLATPAVSAAIDDGILDINFEVLGFEVQKFDAMGFAIKEASEGSKFSKRQVDMIRSMTRGQTILIRAIITKGPDGVTQTLQSPIEVLIN